MLQFWRGSNFEVNFWVNWDLEVIETASQTYEILSLWSVQGMILLNTLHLLLLHFPHLSLHKEIHQNLIINFSKIFIIQQIFLTSEMNQEVKEECDMEEKWTKDFITRQTTNLQCIYSFRLKNTIVIFQLRKKMKNKTKGTWTEMKRGGGGWRRWYTKYRFTFRTRLSLWLFACFTTARTTMRHRVVQ